MDTITEKIKCPECGAMQSANVVLLEPFCVYVHKCISCHYTIMESEWNKQPPSPPKTKMMDKDYLQRTSQGRGVALSIRMALAHHFKTHPEKIPIELVLKLVHNATPAPSDDLTGKVQEMIEDGEALAKLAEALLTKHEVCHLYGHIRDKQIAAMVEMYERAKLNMKFQPDQEEILDVVQGLIEAGDNNGTGELAERIIQFLTGKI